MKCVEVYKHRDSARVSQQSLKDGGIESRIVVDPLESRFPALSTYHGVALMVQDDRFKEASAMLKKAS